MIKITDIEDIDDSSKEGKLLISAISILSAIDIDSICSGRNTIFDFLNNKKDYTQTSTKKILSKVCDISNRVYVDDYDEFILLERKRKLSKI
jgi:hypothetical protein